MFEIDDISHLLSVETEYSLSEIDQKLSERNYTLGYFVPPKNELKLEEALSRKMKNLYSYGELSDLCVSLEIHTKNQKNLKSFLAPRQAAGPDWKNFILGTGHSLGFIYRASLKIFQKPTHFLYLAIGLAHDVASYLLEQEWTRSELKPWIFSRFGNLQLPKGLRVSQNPLVLLTGWAGSRDYIDAYRRGLEERLANRYSWKWIEGKTLQKTAHKLLHEKYSLQPWGGPLKRSKEESKSSLKKKLFEVLTYG